MNDTGIDFSGKTTETPHGHKFAERLQVPHLDVNAAMGVAFGPQLTQRPAVVPCSE